MESPEQTIANLRAVWLKDVGSLPDDELLALAYAFSHSSDRLRVYLELFRGRVGERAQFAASLICFDLAQKGDGAMAAQFAFLRGTLQALSSNENLVAHLVGDQAYLCALWAQCSQTLADAEAASGHDGAGVAEELGVLRAEDAPIAGSLNLLTDDDLDPTALQVDEEAMWRSYVIACEQFFGSGAQMASYDGSMGFRMRNHHGQARAQAFDLALEHCQSFVPPARGMRPLLLMAWGLSLKARGLLGQPNKRRHHLLTQGLQAFVQAKDEVAQVAQVLGPLYAVLDTWPNIAMLLAQYAQYLRQHGQKFVGTNGPLSVDHDRCTEAFVSQVLPQ